MGWRASALQLVLLLVGASVVVLPPAAPAVAVEHDAAKEKKALALTAQAKAAYKAKRYPQAAMLFQRAYAQVPEPTLLFNAARSYQEGGYLREARSLFQLYLTLATYQDAETQAGRAEARKHIANIDTQLRQQAAARRAAAARAGAAGNTTPAGGATSSGAAAAGGRAGSATSGAGAATSSANGAGGTAAGQAGGGTQGPPTATPLQVPPPKGLRPVRRPGLFSRVSATHWTEREIAAVSLMAGGGAVVLTGLILHAVASGTLSDLDDDLARGSATQGGVTFHPGVTQAEAQDAIDSANGLRLGGNMLLGLGTVAAGVGVWLWLGRRLDGDNKLSFTPTVGPSSWGWALQGRF